MFSTETHVLGSPRSLLVFGLLSLTVRRSLLIAIFSFKVLFLEGFIVNSVFRKLHYFYLNIFWPEVVVYMYILISKTIEYRCC